MKLDITEAYEAFIPSSNLGQPTTSVMLDNYIKGRIAHLKVEERAMEKDFVVCYPAIEHLRFDSVLISPDNKFYKIQIKYAENGTREGVVCVDLRKTTKDRKEVRTYHKDEIDAVLVYCKTVNKILWVGPELFDGAQTLSFRFSDSKNRQLKNIRHLDDFVW